MNRYLCYIISFNIEKAQKVDTMDIAKYTLNNTN